jgi:hypothetical protein
LRLERQVASWAGVRKIGDASTRSIFHTSSPLAQFW